MTAPVTLPAAHQPVWADPDALPGVLAELRSRAPLVLPGACRALRAELADVAAGDGFVLQAGDCAEPFADADVARMHAKVDQLEALADVLEAMTGRPVVRIGRFAGQYAKPRSQPTETLPDGRTVPAFMGEAVNGPEPDPAARRPDPRRLLAAYDHAAHALDALFVGRFLPVVSGYGHAGYAQTYVSHEALLMEYERALVRTDPRGDYASSAHMLWIGERTRSLDAAHIAFAESIANPVGVKIGSTASPSEVAELVDRLATAPGRLTLIVRMGAAAVGARLPALLDALGPRASRVVWLTDPMHGNTRRTAAGQKTRVVAEVLAEVRAFFGALTERGMHPGGLHLELTPDAVTECVDRQSGLDERRPLPRYESLCDPRLNPGQSEVVVRTAAELAAAAPNGAVDGRTQRMRCRRSS